MRILWSALLLGFALSVGAQPTPQDKVDERIFRVYLIDAAGKKISVGNITASQSPYGIIFTPAASNLKPGLHGFHVHQNPDCGVSQKGNEVMAGGAAGGHYDPQNTNTHEGPYAEGHLGDLPALFVNDRGEAIHPVLAPRLKINDLDGRSLIIHEGGDNYSDIPEKDGGGGGRVACGLIVEQATARNASPQ